jgi:hypothetical protein
MFFHRSMAYSMMQAWEKEHEMRFDWVVLIRLDAVWVEPVMPIQYYANDRVWLTETGYIAFNDQFMLIPRQYSDFLYDFKSKVEDNSVYCLGGPDVEVHVICNRTALRQQSFTQASSSSLTNETIDSNFLEETLATCCQDALTWNTIGFSELIHYRHLRKGKIPISIARFNVALTRLIERQETRIIKDAFGKKQKETFRVRVCDTECGRLQFHFVKDSEHSTLYPY